MRNPLHKAAFVHKTWLKWLFRIPTSFWFTEPGKHKPGWEEAKPPGGKRFCHLSYWNHLGFCKYTLGWSQWLSDKSKLMLSVTGKASEGSWGDRSSTKGILSTFSLPASPGKPGLPPLLFPSPLQLRMIFLFCKVEWVRTPCGALRNMTESGRRQRQPYLCPPKPTFHIIKMADPKYS